MKYNHDFDYRTKMCNKFNDQMHMNYDFKM